MKTTTIILALFLWGCGYDGKGDSLPYIQLYQGGTKFYAIPADEAQIASFHMEREEERNLPFWDLFAKVANWEHPGVGFDKKTYWLMLFLSVTLLGIAILIGYGIYSLLYGIIDWRRSAYQTLSGIVVGKQFVPEQEFSGTTTTVMPTSGGGIGVGIGSVHSTSEEEFLIFVKADRVYKILVDMQQYFGLKDGDAVRFTIRIGGLSNEALDITLEQ